MEKIFVTIIVPVFNREKLIAATLDSVRMQSFPNWECIIVDDGSSDNSVNVIKSYSERDNRFIFFKRPESLPKGAPSCRNYGLLKSKGKYIKWLDSDDLMDSKCLEYQLNSIYDNKADVSFCKSKLFKVAKDRNISFGKKWPEINLTGNYLENFILGKIRFCNNSGLWSRKILPLNPYYIGLKNSQEYLMILTMLCDDPKLSIVNKELIFIRSHDQRMPAGRSYSTYAYSQCLSRYLAIKVLITKNKANSKIRVFLLKSILYYTLNSLKRGYLFAFGKCSLFFIKSSLTSFKY